MKPNEPPFFIGYLPVPKALNGFLWILTGCLFVASCALGYWIGTTQNDPGPGAQRSDFGRQTLTGVIELTPTPILHVTEGTERIPAGRTLMMSSGGKNGVANRAAAQHGQLARASGAIFERGDLDMLQIRGGRNGLRVIEGNSEIPKPESLGRWKLAGEICDGKCLAGAMRPGRGLAHKACANLCVVGGVPPVFVSSQPVSDEEFLLISGPDGTEIPAAVYKFMAQYISVEGEVVRHGDLLVFALEPTTIQVLP